MRRINPILAFSLLTLALASPEVHAQDDSLSIINFNEASPGQVIAEGTLDPLGQECVFAPGAGRASLHADASILQASLQVSESCQLVIRSLCIGITDCQVGRLPAGLPAIGGGDPMTVGHRCQGCPPPPPGCTGSSGAVADFWNEGYGTVDGVGHGDRLTQTILKLNYGHHCNSGRAAVIDYAGTCWWASHNSWYSDDCHYYQGSSEVGAGITGGFHCSPPNYFCPSVHSWQHTLSSQVNAYNDGNAGCTWYWSGKLPPKSNFDAEYNHLACYYV